MNAIFGRRFERRFLRRVSIWHHIMLATMAHPLTAIERAPVKDGAWAQAPSRQAISAAGLAGRGPFEQHLLQHAKIDRLGQVHVKARFL